MIEYRLKDGASAAESYIEIGGTVTNAGLPPENERRILRENARRVYPGLASRIPAAR